MARGKKKKKQRNQAPTQTKNVEQKETVEKTMAATLDSKSDAEFEKNKAAVLDAFMNDISVLEEEKQRAETAVLEAQGKLAELTKVRDDLQREVHELQSGIAAVKGDYEQALALISGAEEEKARILSEAQSEREKVINVAHSEAEEIRTKAHADAQSIIEQAAVERARKLEEAYQKAEGIWDSSVENLHEQLEELSVRQKELHNVSLRLEEEKQNLDLEREVLAQEKDFVQKLKERYTSANPSRVNELELELNDEREKYRVLLERNESLSERLRDYQLVLDSLKTEIEGADEQQKMVSVNEIVVAMHELREKYESLVSIYEKYPDNRSIGLLEEQAANATRLEAVNSSLEQETSGLKRELQAERNARRELVVVRQQVAAVETLNEHLLQELASLKNALESRTGDACPDLSKVDADTEDDEFRKDIVTRQRRTELTSLEEIVSHVKHYAGTRTGTKLFYTDDDLRAFLSGMAVSRLIILEGMSGTGKSSLPRIFAEAISGFSKLIPVESSWRDRNELLGYYNDFNKKFNAKPFTIELYRSAKDTCQSIPTLMVLDEMNLARIEYYFSDFLAVLQDPNPDQWLIKLVSSDMRTLPSDLPAEVKRKMMKDEPTLIDIWDRIQRSRQGELRVTVSDDDHERLTAYLALNEKLTGAKDLIDGHKLRVTQNIWFVGTANQDESTFEITDKVYDRAQVISFNHRGEPKGKYDDVKQKFISVDRLHELFAEAIGRFTANEIVEERLKRVDDVLRGAFDTSFGNRIVEQAKEFAAVYTAAGGRLEDALDYQIATKIFRKVRSHDDITAFELLRETTRDFDQTKNLIDKRIKTLGRY